MHPRDRREDLVGVEVGTGDLFLQFVREHVDEQLGVRGRVEVSAIDVEQLFRELPRIREVAVVHEHDAVGRVHVERLRLLLVRRCALGGITHVTETDVARKRAHVAGAESLAHLPLGFHHVEGATLCGGDSGGVLTAVLQKQKAVVDLLVGGFRRNDADYAAHF